MFGCLVRSARPPSINDAHVEVSIVLDKIVAIGKLGVPPLLP